jgi:NADH dehydrogenase
LPLLSTRRARRSLRRGRYDKLEIAIGSVTNGFGTESASDCAVPLETPTQAKRFNRRLFNAFLRVQTQKGPVLPGQLHVAIVGADATGTELAAELYNTTREMVAYGLHRIDPWRDIRVVHLHRESDHVPLAALDVREGSGRHDTRAASAHCPRFRISR